MGTHVHKIVSVDAPLRRGVCRKCGPVAVKRNGPTSGIIKWRCAVSKNQNKRPWIIHKKDRCEECGFVPQHPMQLDVDHIDGNKGNNDPLNLKTLCANCHRLKTYISRDSYSVDPLDITE